MELNADMLLQFVVSCSMDTVKQQMLWVLLATGNFCFVLFFLQNRFFPI